jgi:hypothetical protein
LKFLPAPGTPEAEALRLNGTGVRLPLGTTFCPGHHFKSNKHMDCSHPESTAAVCCSSFSPCERVADVRWCHCSRDQAGVPACRRREEHHARESCRVPGLLGRSGKPDSQGRRPSVLQGRGLFHRPVVQEPGVRACLLACPQVAQLTLTAWRQCQCRGGVSSAMRCL